MSEMFSNLGPEVKATKRKFDIEGTYNGDIIVTVKFQIDGANLMKV